MLGGLSAHVHTYTEHRILLLLWPKRCETNHGVNSRGSLQSEGGQWCREGYLGTVQNLLWGVCGRNQRQEERRDQGDFGEEQVWEIEGQGHRRYCLYVNRLLVSVLVCLGSVWSLRSDLSSPVTLFLTSSWVRGLRWHLSVTGVGPWVMGAVERWE